MTADPKDDLKPQTQPQAGGSGKPPKPTAIGTGGSGDDDDYYRRVAYKRESHAPAKLIPTWPIPDLIFKRINMPGAADCDLSAALPDLHKAGANIAHLVLSSGRDLLTAVGVTASASERIPESAPLDRAEIDERMHTLSRSVGTVTGLPVASGTSSEAPPLERLTAELKGQPFGILTLAAPIPQARFELDEEALLANIEQARSDDDPETAKRSRYRMQADLLLLERLRSGAASGLWQNCTYIFSSQRQTFNQLSSSIVHRLGDIKVKPTLICHVDLSHISHLESLAMPLSRWTNDELPSLDTYKHLTPLSCDQLALFFSGPKQNP
ncbi:MAG: hypothetical protein KGS72_04940 [Cyanobacteria bacterium REEB67]|nr:hypothetical protein [Cyanobacteria bacterium REEB67]